MGQGVGKSTWASVLADQNLRKMIGANIPGLENTKVQIGLSESRERETAKTCRPLDRKGQTPERPLCLVHLADGRKMTSPRSFLAAIRQAAEDSLNRDSEFPLYYGSILTGRAGSKTLA
jgi:hypothetical protein